MKKYIDGISKELKNYFEILEPNYPEWLDEYIDTKEMLMQNYISVSCGTIYTNLFSMGTFYSSLDHSVAVALIIWHFTKDKKQTLAGLFHDIATPAFKHCVDFLNGDYIMQESTEDLTTEIIKNSKEIMNLLRRDNIDLYEVNDYHKYPIADNDTPKLSADRLEYSLSNSLFVYNSLDISKIKEIYEDINIQQNEDKVIELGFKNLEIAREFVNITSKLSVVYREDKTRYSMQFIADILKNLSKENLITKQDLYRLKEQEIIDIIEKSKYNKVFNTWKNAKKVTSSKTKPEKVYYVHHEAKIRYIDPLLMGERISKIDEISKKYIEDNLNYDMNSYIYLDSILI